MPRPEKQDETLLCSVISEQGAIQQAACSSAVQLPRGSVMQAEAEGDKAAEAAQQEGGEGVLREVALLQTRLRLLATHALVRPLSLPLPLPLPCCSCSSAVCNGI